MSTNPPTVLTTEDIRALATADYVVFYQARGRAYIKSGLRNGPDGRIYTAREQRTFPQIDERERSRDVETAVRMFGYGTDSGQGWNLERDPHAIGFYMIHTPEFTPTWQTIVNLMRAGDTLRLVWAADNNTDNHREVGFHADSLDLEILRGKHVLTFRVASQVGPDNSARMIRQHG